MQPDSSARLLISCADRPGIVAAVSRLLAVEGANITQSDQYTTDPQGGEFFMRVEFQIADEARMGLRDSFAEVAQRFGMDWRLSAPGERKLVMVSKPDHCLLDLLWRWRRGELDCDIRSSPTTWTSRPTTIHSCPRSPARVRTPRHGSEGSS